MNELQAAREKAVHLRRMGHSTAEVATELGYSPQWVRKWWRRYQAFGWVGLADQSHAPHQHGRRLSQEVRRAVVEARSELEAEAARGEGLKYIGGRAVRTRLRAKKNFPLPSVASIERIVREEKMTKPREKKPEVVYPRLRPQQPHQLCQVDHIPRYLQGGQKVYCFNALDVVSRYPTGQVYTHRRASDARAFLSHVWQTIGIAHYTQVDNEACFSGGFTHPYVLGQCVRLALMVGTELVFSPVRYPKSNGTVERFHQDYQLHVWQDTYLADLKAIQSQADYFFDLYRHSQHHSALKEETPAMLHHPTPSVPLDKTFNPPESKLPLYAGQLHFIRQVQPDGIVSVLNVDWSVPNPDPQQAVWVTLELTPDQAILSIYDDAPDALERTCLVSYPFPIKEPVLPRSSVSTTIAHQPKPAPDPEPEPPHVPISRSPASLILGRWLPANLTKSTPQPAPQFVRATLTRTANFVRNVAETMF